MDINTETGVKIEILKRNLDAMPGNPLEAMLNAMDEYASKTAVDSLKKVLEVAKEIQKQ